MSNSVREQTLIDAGLPFVRYLAARQEAEREESLSKIIATAGSPEKVAIVVVDVINGFCVSGALASERVGAIVEPIAELLRQADRQRITNIALLCDTHTPHAEEFHQFAVHCVQGTVEAEPVDALKALPAYTSYKMVRKNSISPWFNPDDLAGWLGGLPGGGPHTVIVVGDCTDLCTYQVAVPLKLSANQDDRPLRIVVPRDCVQTYDLPLDVAQQVGALPHSGDLLHEVFLYHMSLHGIEVVSHIAP
ncbi:MAG TPA: isochorismatase family protein [Chloroflexota bacterium]|nr:isochorismatase family protein [Chloroflexota bacterium]